MTGGIIEILIIMLIVATVAFAPLAYFIRKYTDENGQPFGETEPHGDSPSLVNDLAETVIHTVSGLIGKKK